MEERSPSIAIGYFGARILEVGIFILSAISLLTLVTVSKAFVGAGAPAASYFTTLGDMLLAIREWGGHAVLDVAVFPLGALLLNGLLYRARLVPRWVSGWGFVGAALYWAAGLLVLFGMITPLETFHIVLQAPLGVQEIALALWLIVRGFNPSAVAAG
ncbi:DUF4386 domain-containing protein [Candidatus Bipolaricaulota bacterium]|nr:DUF4386 domain-containing protein [Candidatus Bipolaricaulota bacterium]